MAEFAPRLHSLSTVCLLKHYNQDYRLHPLRTDFTGSNGVGKSIIADLFQVVFLADTRHIKFATEGLDKKGRKIETLPYESGIGYVFFNVEVKSGAFVTIGAAIFAQGNTIVKPFIITSSIDYEKVPLDLNTFPANKLFRSTNFLNQNREAYTLDDLARIAPEKYQLYVHSFGTREEKASYYDWLYQNGLLPINLVKEGNLKAFAKVIQSFSKSKTLDIGNSKSLIEHLFEEDEQEITQEYSQQEQTIRKLLHNFKTTKGQIQDISDKQLDLTRLKGYDEGRKKAEHDLAFATYITTSRQKAKKQEEVNRKNKEIKQKEERFEELQNKAGKFFSLVTKINQLSKKAQHAFTELASSQSLFTRLEKLQAEDRLLDIIETGGLITSDPDNAPDLLGRDAKLYTDTIQKSASVLKRYTSMEALEEKKKEQDRWLREQIRSLEDKEKQLSDFQQLLKDTAQNSLFIKTLAVTNSLSKPQQAVLVYLRQILLSKPVSASSGDRYTHSVDLIQNLRIEVDKDNKGWWIQTGDLFEFVPETSTLLPDLSETKFQSPLQLKDYLQRQSEILNQQKAIYDSLSNGIIPKDFSAYDFDEELSDATKLSNHKLAAQFCSVISEKKRVIKSQQTREIEEIQKAKDKYGISAEDIEYEALLNETRRRRDILQNRHEKLKKSYDYEQTEISGFITSMPLLNETYKTILAEFQNANSAFKEAESKYKDKYPQTQAPDIDTVLQEDIATLESVFSNAAGTYINYYNQLLGKYEETKDRRSISVNEQIDNKNYSFEILEQALLGNRIRTLDEVTGYLEGLNTELLSITEDLLRSLVKVFGKTETYFDKYRKLVQDLNDFFIDKLISNRFNFRIDFNTIPKLDIKWIEHLRKSAHNLATSSATGDVAPEKFIEDFYLQFSGNKTRILIDDLLNPKRYFSLKGKLTDELGRENSGSTGESYTAIALLGIARLSIVQDGERPGLRFIILEESATLDNVNFNMFPTIAKQYGYQIITMTPKPYAIGGDEGWFIHQLIPGKENKDINFHKVMSYFRTNKTQIELDNYLITK